MIFCYEHEVQKKWEICKKRKLRVNTYLECLKMLLKDTWLSSELTSVNVVRLSIISIDSTELKIHAVFEFLLGFEWEFLIPPCESIDIINVCSHLDLAWDTRLPELLWHIVKLGRAPSSRNIGITCHFPENKFVLFIFIDDKRLKNLHTMAKVWWVDPLKILVDLRQITLLRRAFAEVCEWIWLPFDVLSGDSNWSLVLLFVIDLLLKWILSEFLYLSRSGFISDPFLENNPANAPAKNV